MDPNAPGASMANYNQQLVTTLASLCGRRDQLNAKIEEEEKMCEAVQYELQELTHQLTEVNEEL
jgi:hypothetical protein